MAAIPMRSLYLCEKPTQVGELEVEILLFHVLQVLEHKLICDQSSGDPQQNTQSTVYIPAVRRVDL